MSARMLSLGLLVALAGAAPAGAHARSAPFPSLRAVAGKAHKARAVERRVRRIESSLLGAGHAAEHSRQRALRRRALSAGPGPMARTAGAPLQVDNSLVARQAGGEWATPSTPLPIVAINATLMRTGKVLIFAYPWRPGRPDPDNPGQTLTDAGYSDAYVFDPVTGTSKKVDPPLDPATADAEHPDGKPARIFCAGTSTLPDGSVLVTGGNVGDPTGPVNHGLNTIYTFDPVTETWATQQRMRQGRWYPTQLEMGDGRTVIVAGLPNTGDPDDAKKANTDVEIFSPDGSLQRLDSLKVDGKTDDPPLIGQYPHMFWMPSGHALVAGPRTSDTWTFTPPTPGHDDASWDDIKDLPTHREWAAGALLAGTSKVMLFGGAGKDDRYSGTPTKWPATATTTFFDDADPDAGWQKGPQMNVARAFANSVMLPDGKVAIVGGGSGEDSSNQYYRWLYTEDEKRVELFDPQADTFTEGNAQAEARTYHSTALLLPDGRVMSAGDDINGPTGPDSGVKTDTAELWSPPYLFDSDGDPAARPALTFAPQAIQYGKPFAAGTPDSDIAKAVLVAPGAATHANDMSQRVVPLAAPMSVTGGVNLVAPASADLAPPGYYMLFLLDAHGVPSTARFVRVGPEPAALEPLPTPTPTATEEPPVEPSPSPSPTPKPTPTKPLRVRLTAPQHKLRRVLRKGRLPAEVSVSDSATVRLRAAVKVDGHWRRLARPLTRDFRADRPRRARLQLTRAGLRRLARGGRRAATVRLTATARPPSGAKVRATRRARLR